MVLRDEKIIKRFFAWFYVWYFLEAILIFSIVMGKVILSETNINAPINILFIVSMGSLLWPGIVLLFFIFGVSLTPVFLLIFGSIIISSLTGITIEYKYNICYPRLFDLLRRLDERIIREMSAWFFFWYIFEVMVMFSWNMSNSALSLNKTSGLIDVLVITGILSIFWPIITFLMFFLVDVTSSAFFLVPFGSSLIFFIISLIVKYKFNFSYSKVFDLIDKK